MAYRFYDDIRLVGWFIDRIRAPYSAHTRIITWRSWMTVGVAVAVDMWSILSVLYRGGYSKN